MKRSIPKFSMNVPLPLMLGLILIVSFSSCSQPNLGDIVREHIEAVNNDDIEKNLTLFADEIVFEIGSDAKLSGIDQLRGLLENDVASKVRLTIIDTCILNVLYSAPEGNDETIRKRGVSGSATAPGAGVH